MNDERNSKKSSSSSSMMDISTYGSITQNLFDAMNGLDIGSWKYKHQSIDSSFDDPDDHEEIDFKSGDDDNDDDEYDENSSKPNESLYVSSLEALQFSTWNLKEKITIFNTKFQCFPV